MCRKPPQRCKKLWRHKPKVAPYGAQRMGNGQPPAMLENFFETGQGPRPPRRTLRVFFFKASNVKPTYIFIAMFNSTCGIHVIIISYSKKIEYYCHQSLRTSSLEPILDLLEAFKNNCNKNGGIQESYFPPEYLCEGFHLSSIGPHVVTHWNLGILSQQGT